MIFKNIYTIAGKYLSVHKLKTVEIFHKLYMEQENRREL